MKYARNVGGTYLDPVSIPQPWPEGYWTNDPVEFCERMFPDTTGWELVPDDTGEVAPTLRPKLLSKTGFQDLAWAAFGGGTTGMARFNVIMSACKSGNDVLQAIFSRYDAADTFAKEQVATLTDLMVRGAVMTPDERTAILAAWPNA